MAKGVGPLLAGGSEAALRREHNLFCLRATITDKGVDVRLKAVKSYQVIIYQS